jgi:hypothetical protein
MMTGNPDRIVECDGAGQPYLSKPLHLIEAACPIYRRRAMINHETLSARRPTYTRLIDLDEQLRCRRCGHRGGIGSPQICGPRDQQSDSSPAKGE